MPAEAAVDAQRQHWLLIFCQRLRTENGKDTLCANRCIDVNGQLQ